MFLDTRLGNTPRWFFSQPRDWNMRVPDEIRDCVVFVGRVLRAGSREERRLTGTAFVASVPVTCGLKLSFLYLVTARHVAHALSLGDWFIRLNTNAGPCEEARLGVECRWWFHPDPAVDAAVTTIAFPADARIVHISTEMFATDEIIEKRRIGPGDEVFITGLFTKATGKSVNMPVVRMAHIATMPKERLPNIMILGKRYESEVYLVEARSLGGISGSPAFVVETVRAPVTLTSPGPEPVPIHMHAGGAFFLLGLMHGHWLIKEKESNEVEVVSFPPDEGSIATGIAVVVPAKNILEILNCEELATMRQEKERELSFAAGSTTSDCSESGRC